MDIMAQCRAGPAVSGYSRFGYKDDIDSPLMTAGLLT